MWDSKDSTRNGNIFYESIRLSALSETWKRMFANFAILNQGEFSTAIQQKNANSFNWCCQLNTFQLHKFNHGNLEIKKQQELESSLRSFFFWVFKEGDPKYKLNFTDVSHLKSGVEQLYRTAILVDWRSTSKVSANIWTFVGCDPTICFDCNLID